MEIDLTKPVEIAENVFWVGLSAEGRFGSLQG
jgi:hypothetical protein